MSTKSIEDIDIPVPWGHISGKWWGPKDKQPVLGLHGWQDNAASFDTLAPLLPDDVGLLCIDMIGHGRSSHFPKGQMYYFFWEAVIMLRRIVKYFKWNSISILGHSRGGSIGFMYAAFYPDQVDKLICLDIAYPKLEPVDKLVEESGKTIDRFLQYENLADENMPCYGYSEMIDLVESAYNGSISTDSAKILMNRGMKPARKKPGSFHFTRDVKLKVGSVLGMVSKEHSLVMAGNIRCEYLNVQADPGLYIDSNLYSDVLDVIKKNAKHFEHHILTGSHHVHLNNPEKVAGVISTFLLRKDEQ